MLRRNVLPLTPFVLALAWFATEQRQRQMVFRSVSGTNLRARSPGHLSEHSRGGHGWKDEEQEHQLLWLVASCPYQLSPLGCGCSWIYSKQAPCLFWPFFPGGGEEETLKPFAFLFRALLLCLRLFLALWQFVLQVVKQNVYLKINYSKILINSFFSRESHVFLLHTSSLLWK